MRPLRFGAGLTLRSRGSIRLATVVTTCVMAVGVLLLLIVAAVPDALDHRAARGDARAPRYGSGAPAKALVGDGSDTWRGALIRRVSVVVLDPQVVPPPGLDRLPGPGELVVSPALAAAVDSPDGAGLRARYGGHR